MMHPLAGLVIAGILAGIGYLCLWAGTRADARGMKLFGRVLGIVLLCVAGLALVGHIVMMPCRPGPCGLGPHAGLVPGGCGGGPGPVRVEKRVCRVDEDDEEDIMGELLPGMFEDFIAESPEFEARVREIVTEMQDQK